MIHSLFNQLYKELFDLKSHPRGSGGCTCGTPPFAPPEPSSDCPFHADGLSKIASQIDALHHDYAHITLS